MFKECLKINFKSLKVLLSLLISSAIDVINVILDKLPNIVLILGYILAISAGVMNRDSGWLNIIAWPLFLIILAYAAMALCYGVESVWQFFFDGIEMKVGTSLNLGAGKVLPAFHKVNTTKGIKAYFYCPFYCVLIAAKTIITWMYKMVTLLLVCGLIVGIWIALEHSDVTIPFLYSFVTPSSAADYSGSTIFMIIFAFAILGNIIYAIWALRDGFNDQIESLDRVFAKKRAIEDKPPVVRVYSQENFDKAMEIITVVHRSNNKFIEQVKPYVNDKFIGDNLNKYLNIYRSVPALGLTYTPNQLLDGKDQCEELMRIRQAMRERIAQINAAKQQSNQNNQNRQNNQGSQNRQQNNSSVNAGGNKLVYFHGCADMKQLDERYRKLAQAMHPDNSFGDEELFKAMSMEYQMVKKTMA